MWVIRGKGHHQHIWTAQSNPNNEPMGVKRPIMADKPIVGHPPPFEKVIRASVAVARGERTHKVITTARKPIIWMHRTMLSTTGSLLARAVLNITQNAVIAQTSKVPCQRSKPYEGMFRTMRPCMMVPVMNPTDSSPACHPVIQIQPVCGVLESDQGWDEQGQLPTR